MAYHLGIDLGTTYTAAAMASDGRVEAVPLGHRAVAIPSVLYIKDNEFMVGEAANRRAVTEPERVAREFKRRVGDPTPILIGGAPLAPELLMARLLRWVLDQVTASEGAPPASITVTHPANWGAYKLDLLQSAIRHVGVESARYVPEPVAAATFYASQRPLAAGSVVAVYDLGGGTFDAAVVRKTASGFEITGRPEGIERLGGVDFDHAVFNHVLASLGAVAEQFDADEPGMVSAVAQLREECVEAKEALSGETDVDIAVLLPGRQTEVRLTRGEFENMIRPAVSETIVALHRALASAGVRPDQVSAVLLVGGSSRIPLVAQMVTADLGRPVAVDARPKDAIALGAALAGWQAALPGPVTAPAEPVAAAFPAPPPAFPAPPPVAPHAPLPNRKPWAIAAAAAAVVLLLAGFFGIRALLGDDDPDDQTTDTTTAETTTTSEEDTTDTTESTGEVTSETLPGDDWGPEAESAFVSECTSGSPSPTEDQCQCIYDIISEGVGFDEWNQASIEFAESNDPSDLPPEASSAPLQCASGG